MKLDKIKFARLIGWLASEKGTIFCDSDLESIDALIDVEVPAVSPNRVPVEAVDELLKQMAMSEKIPAIKAYRVLTGAGLKESKDAVEKYWLRQPAPDVSGATLGDILKQVNN